MAKFHASRDLSIRWNGFDFFGAAGTVFRIPDAYVDEFTNEVVPQIIGGVTWDVADEEALIPSLPIAESNVTNLVSDLAGKAASVHTHVESDVTSLTTDLAAKLALAGGTLTGTVVGPAFEAKGLPWYDVKAYGATGNGTTDDQAAITAAISVAAAGSTVFFPPGTYLVDSAIGTITKALTFLGYGATLRAGTAGLDSWALKIGDGVSALSGVTIAGLTFDSNNLARTMVDCYLVTDLRVADCEFTGYTYANGYSTTDSALRLNGCPRAIVSGCTFHDLTYGNGGTNLHRAITLQEGAGSVKTDPSVVEGCSFATCDQGIVIADGTHIRISDCSFDHLSDNGLYVLSTTACAISGCTFNDCEESVVLYGSSSVAVTGCTFLEWTNKGITLKGTTDRIAIVGNTFRNSSINSFIAYDSTSTQNRLTIADNVMVGADGFAGIFLDTVTGLSVTGNQVFIGFTTSGGFFLRVAGDVEDGLVSHNIFDASLGTQVGQLRFTGTNTSVRIFDNLFTGGAAMGTTLGGSILAGSGQPSCRVYNSTAISLTTATATALTFDSEREDVPGFHSTTTNTSRLMVPTGYGGVYVATGVVAYTANATGSRQTSIRVNGSTRLAIDRRPASPSTGITGVSVSSGPFRLADGDYVELVCYQDSGGALTVSAGGDYSPEFGLVRIGD